MTAVGSKHQHQQCKPQELDHSKLCHDDHVQGAAVAVIDMQCSRLPAHCIKAEQYRQTLYKQDDAQSYSAAAATQVTRRPQGALHGRREDDRRARRERQRNISEIGHG